MAKTAFISYSFSNKHLYEGQDAEVRRLLLGRGIKAYSFVYDYKLNKGNRETMRSALAKISESDLVIAELSHKSIGVGIEIGYAKALKKPIIYIHKTGTEISTTADGISDFRVEYGNQADLAAQLVMALDKLGF